jgi:hypothetical protein
LPFVDLQFAAGGKPVLVALDGEAQLARAGLRRHANGSPSGHAMTMLSAGQFLQFHQQLQAQGRLAQQPFAVILLGLAQHRALGDQVALGIAFVDQFAARLPACRRFRRSRCRRRRRACSRRR